MGVRDRLTRMFSDEAEPEPPTALDRRDYQTPALRKVLIEQARAGGAAGVDGESWYGGLWGDDDETSASLIGGSRYRVYQQMRTSDPAVRSALWMFKLPIRSAQWSLEEPPLATREEQLATEACRWQFGLEGHDGEMTQSWDQQLHQALLYLDWGAMGEEIIWGDMAAFTPDDGGPPIPLRTILRLAPRSPGSVQEIDVDPASGQVIRLLQSYPEAKPIPGQKLSWIVFEREGAGVFGTSLLRAMYGPWKLKRALVQASAVAWDRWASGIPIVRYPSRQHQAAAERMAGNLRVHERAYATLEGPKESGWDVEILQADPADATPMLRYYDEQIAAASLQMMKMLGGTPFGSRAGAEVLSDPYYLGVSAVAKEVALERRKQVFSKYVLVNFGERVRPPVIKVAKIQGKNVAVLARALADAASAGLSFTDRDSNNDFRDAIEFERLPEETAAVLDGLPADVGLAPAGEGEGIGLPPAPPAR
jgi:hypothetical protein